MKQSRYIELSTNPEEQLTKEEIVQGFHFCPDWDGMLVEPGAPEFGCCLCGIKEGTQ